MAELEVTKAPNNNNNTQEMKPWEQHSAVISIPRYDYKAPTSLLRRSFSGFLVTCPISFYFAPYLCLCFHMFHKLEIE